MGTVDVIIPLYNGAPWIRETLDSVLAQTLKPGKIIVVDDGSTDNSVDLVYNRPEIFLLHNPGKGSGKAKNYGLEHSSADFVAFLDQDDLWHPEHLRLLVGALTAHPEAQAAVSRIDYFNSGRPPRYHLGDFSFQLWDPWQSFPSIYEDHTTSGIVFRSVKFKENGGWAIEHINNSDYFAWYRSAIDAPAIKMNTVTFGCRKHDSGWMKELRKDVLGLLGSVCKAADALTDIYLAKKVEQSQELYLRRRNAVYHTLYSLIDNLKRHQDALLIRDIQNLEGLLTHETPYFRNLFMRDLKYFLNNLGENQGRSRKAYLLKLRKCCPKQAGICQNMFLTMLEQVNPGFDGGFNFRKKSDKPVVAHYHSRFFDRAETFIYYYVTQLSSFHPLYIAKEFINLDVFPLPKNDLRILPGRILKKYTWQWLYYGTLRKFMGVNISDGEIILRESGAKLIHAHFGPRGFSALKLRGKFKIPIITSFYGYDVSQLTMDPEWLRRYSILFKEGNLFLVEGAFMKARLMELGCPENKIRIQRIAIPVDNIPFRPRKPKKAGEKVILTFSGRFIEKKGLLYALQAVKKVLEQGKECEFRIIGDGPLRPQVEDFIKAAGLTEHVKLLGFLSSEMYIKEMSKADLFLHPSVTAQDGDSEGGAPTVILEAQATGLPVISTLHADIPNIVVPGKSALLSPEKDSEALAKNIIYLLDNQHAWESMGSAGREFVEKFHNINNEINALEEKYRSVLSHTRNRVFYG